MTKYHINKNGVPAPCKAQKGNCPYGGEELHFNNLEKAEAHANEMLESEYGLIGKEKDESKTYTKEITEADVRRIQKEYSSELGEITPIKLVYDMESLSRRFGPYSHVGRYSGEFEVGGGDLDSLYKEIREFNNGSYKGSIDVDTPIHVISDKVYEPNETPKLAGSEEITAYRSFVSGGVEHYNKTMINLNGRINRLNESLIDFAEKSSIKNRKSKTITCKKCGERMNTSDVRSHGITTSEWKVEQEHDDNIKLNVPSKAWNKCLNGACGETLNSASVQKAYASKVSKINELKGEMRDMYEKRVKSDPNREVYWRVDWSG